MKSTENKCILSGCRNKAAKQYPNTIAFIRKASIKESDQSKLIKKISNKYCIDENSAKRWIQSVVGVGQRFK